MTSLIPVGKGKKTFHMTILSQLKASCYPIIVTVAGIFNRITVIQSLIEI